MGYRKPILVWLGWVNVLILAIIVVGGITRLTSSGLSMVDWKPIMGILPPLSEGQWIETFKTYQLFPEYQTLTVGMSLSEFKFIFFWEYLHRILGRVIGLSLIIPYLYFLLKKKLSSHLKVRGLVMILLVICQGLLGWYMVKSGLVNNPHVSHFRLASHLLLAFFLFQYIWWTMLGIWFADRPQPSFIPSWIRSACWILLFILILQIIYGAFVAGLHAGYGYNTFPKMGLTWVPDGLWLLDGTFNNLVNNKITLQFIHRSLAWTLLFGGSIVGFSLLNIRSLSQYQRTFTRLMLAALALQFLLGVMTLLFMIPLSLAVAHQFGAIALLTCVVGVIYQIRSYPPY